MPRYVAVRRCARHGHELEHMSAALLLFERRRFRWTGHVRRVSSVSFVTLRILASLVARLPLPPHPTQGIPPTLVVPIRRYRRHRHPLGAGACCRHRAGLVGRHLAGLVECQAAPRACLGAKPALRGKPRNYPTAPPTIAPGGWGLAFGCGKSRLLPSAKRGAGRQLKRPPLFLASSHPSHPMPLLSLLQRPSTTPTASTRLRIQKRQAAFGQLPSPLPTLPTNACPLVGMIYFYSISSSISVSNELMMMDCAMAGESMMALVHDCESVNQVGFVQCKSPDGQWGTRTLSVQRRWWS